MRRIRDLSVLKEDLRAKTDLAAFVSRYVTLTQRGKNFWANCPFHEETTPSFNVTPEKGVWSCLGCRESGDLFTFAQKMHNGSFADALEIVAESTGFDLEPYYRELTPEEELREQRYEVMAQVADAMHEQLLLNPTMLSFYAERGINRDTLALFKIGFCPSLAWLQTLVTPDILDFIEPNYGNRGNLFDGHLVYPQFTPPGQVWGFYARQAPGVKPKYVGPSRESALFEGGHRLYGLFQARKLMRQTKAPFSILEGFHDAMKAQQEGVPAVATCGTELATDQVQTLQAYAIREAVVVFDGDDGGLAGMLRLALNAHKIHSLNLKFARIPGDPDEFIHGRGIEAFLIVLHKAVCAVEYVVSHYAHMDVSTPSGKLDFLNEVRTHLKQYPRRSVQRALGVQAAAEVIAVDSSVVADYLEEDDQNHLVNVRGEIVVLAELAQNREAWNVAIRTQDFSLERHRKTFDLMQELYQDSGAVNHEMLMLTAQNNAVPAAVLDTIRQLPYIDRSNAEAFLNDVREKSLRRHVRELAYDNARAIADLNAKPEETLGTLIESVTDLMVGKQNRHVLTSAEATALAIDEFERKSAREGNEVDGLDLGPDFSYLMGWTNGLRPKRVHVIAAVSGAGKSVVLKNWVHRLSVAENGPHAAGMVVTMEMDVNECIGRLVSMESGVPHANIDRARFDSYEQYEAGAAAFERVRTAPLTWIEQQKAVKEIALEARILQARGALDYIGIDYVQLLNVDCYSSKWSMYDKYAAASQEIKNLADSLGVPIILVAQLNRAAYQEDTPTGEQMGSCIKIVQDAHVLYTLAPRDVGLLGFLAKNRGGASGKATNLAFDRDQNRSTLKVKELSLRGSAQ